MDLNKILFYADKNSVLQKTKQRRYFSIIDGIISGEGEGPLSPTPKHCGILVGGMNPVFVDAVGVRLMGFNIDKIPILRNAFNIAEFPLVNGVLEDIVIRSNIMKWDKISNADIQYFTFEPSKGWKDHIEL